MNRPATQLCQAALFGTLALALAAVGVSQTGGKRDGLLRFADKKGDKANIVVEARDLYVEPEVRFVAKGAVHAILVSQGADIRSDQATGNILSEPDPKEKGKKRTSFDNLDLTGNVRLELSQKSKDRDGVPVESNTVATGKRLTYNISKSDPKFAQIELSGGIKTITKGSSAKGVNDVEMTGSQGAFLTLRDPAKGEDGVKEATITGSVSINVKQRINTDKGPQNRTFIAKSDRLVYKKVDKSPSEATVIEMIDNLDLKTLQEDEEGPEITGATVLYLVLNDKNEVVSFKISNGSGGTVQTRIKPRKSKGGGR